MTEYDAYSLSSGLPSDFDFNITEAAFVTDSRYNDGNTVLLKLEGTTDHPDAATYDMLLSCGTGWEIVGRGEAIQSENGKARNFNKNSGMGLFLDRAIKAGALDTLRKRGVPQTAATWAGLGFHMDLEEIDRGDYGKKDVLLPTAFLGEGGAAAPAGKGTPTTDDAGVPKAVIAKLKSAAKKAADYAEFVDAAFAIDEVNANPEAAALAADEEFYNQHAAA